MFLKRYTYEESRDVHVRVVRTGLISVSLRFPAAVPIDELSQEGSLLGVACDELVLQ